MRKVLHGLVFLVAFFSLSAGAAVFWQRPVQSVRTGHSQGEAESLARMQLNSQLSALQSQCQSQQGVALVFQFQKNCRQVTPFSYECDLRVTMSCES